MLNFLTGDVIIVTSFHLTSLHLSPFFAPVALRRSLNPAHLSQCDSLNHYSLLGTLRSRHLAKAALMCDAWQGDGVIVAVVQFDESINGSSRLMEGGGPTCSLLSGVSCNRAGRNLSGWAAELYFMFWMSPCSFLPPRAGMIWMSPARVMFLKHEVHPPECFIVIQLTERSCQLCRC